MYEIPLEILDLFLEYLHLDRDRHALGSCSLVCQAWLPVARRHFLSDVTVKFSTCDADQVLQGLLSSPLCTIAPYIHNLHIQGTCPALPPAMVQAALAAIRRLPNIHNVTLQDMTWPLVPVELRSMIASYDLTSISFSFVFFTTSHELYQLLSSFPALTALSMGYGIRWMERNPDTTFRLDPTPTATPPSKRLTSVRKLSVDTSKEPLMSFLLQLTAPASIDALEMRFVSIPQKLLVDEFLNRTTLKHLTLDFGKIGQGPGTIHFDLGSHTQLRSLTLEGLILSRSYYTSPKMTWAACMALLSTVKSRNLELLTICLLNLKSVADVDWTMFEGVLEGSAFATLKTVVLRLNVFADSEPGTSHAEAIRASLPKANARRLLEFEHVQHPQQV
ncbi:hypothetical protein APHAL10511_000463 [Amanita phalloides]|nr:hypothetical protein APHAL10511_000463 [Amanita phalloides]